MNWKPALVMVIRSSLAAVADKLLEGPRLLGRMLAVVWFLPSLLPLKVGVFLSVLGASLFWLVLGAFMLKKLTLSLSQNKGQLGSAICARMVILSVSLAH